MKYTYFLFLPLIFLHVISAYSMKREPEQYDGEMTEKKIKKGCDPRAEIREEEKKFGSLRNSFRCIGNDYSDLDKVLTKKIEQIEKNYVPEIEKAKKENKEIPFQQFAIFLQTIREHTFNTELFAKLGFEAVSQEIIKNCFVQHAIWLDNNEKPSLTTMFETYVNIALTCFKQKRESIEDATQME